MAAVITGPPPAQPARSQEIGNGQRSEAFPASVSATKFEERPLRGAKTELESGFDRGVAQVNYINATSTLHQLGKALAASHWARPASPAVVAHEVDPARLFEGKWVKATDGGGPGLK
jgi:hypothetical protein